jgi:hypothetical protein
LSNPKTFKGLMDGLLAGFQMIFNFAASMTQTIVKTFVQGLAGIASMIPGIGPALARSIAEPIASIEKLQKETAKQGEALRARMSASMGSTASDILERAKTMPRSNVDFLGAGKQADEVATLSARLSQLGKVASEADKYFSQINATYQTEVEAIYMLFDKGIIELEERIRRIDRLKEQYRAAGAAGLAAYGEPSANLAPPQAQMQQNAMTQSARNEMARQSAQELMPTKSEDEVATETTLKKVATLMQELTQKLPQPVLV